MTLWLASRSTARRKMLDAAGVDHRPIDVDFDEEAAKRALAEARPSPAQLAALLAEGKARAARVSEEGWVLGSDQTLETADGQVLGKPRSIEEAKSQLRLLAGRTHQLHSAAVIVAGGQRLWDATESVGLRMRDLSEAFLDSYFEREGEAVCQSVGAYRIEGLGAQLFEQIEGSYFAILGLPLLPLLAFLRERGRLTS